jgi:hypothetical protein
VHDFNFLHKLYFQCALGLVYIVPALAFGSIVGFLLIIGLYQSWKSLFTRRVPFVNLIIRDGVLYFLAVFGSNVVWVVIGVLVPSEILYGKIKAIFALKIF